MTRLEDDKRRHRRPKPKTVQRQALPVVSVATLSRRQGSQDKSTRKPQRVGAANITENKKLCEDPMDDVFEDVLDALDKFLDIGTSGRGASYSDDPKPYLLPCMDTHRGSTGKDTSRINPRQVTRAKSMPLRKGENGQLPRLRLNPSDDDITSAGRLTKAGGSLPSKSKKTHYMISSRVSTTTNDDTCLRQGNKLLVDVFDDGSFDRKLSCRQQPSSKAHEGTTAPTYTGETTLHDELGPKADTRRKLVNSVKENDTEGDLTGCVSASAGVFRVWHPSTGFVHYGYTWDIFGAKEHQLRLLREGTHPHRGLSNVLRGQHSPTARWRRKEREIRFEVVHRMPLPSRFHASEFEQTLREACSRELTARRSGLLVLMMRHIRRKYVFPAFQHILAVCRHLAEIEAIAAVDAQRTWRGYLGRTTARLERKEQDLTRWKRFVVAVWIQARHRARKISLRENTVIAAEAATKVQRWLRSSLRWHQEATAKCGGDIVAGYVVSGTAYVDPEIPVKDTTTDVSRAQGTVTGISGPTSASELMVTKDLRSTDNLCSRQSITDEHCPPLQFETREGGKAHDKGKEEHWTSLLAEGVLESSSEETYHNPTSKGSTARSTGATTLGLPIRHTEKTNLGTDKALNASQLVLEETTLFTSARAIQACWRGFIVRLMARKRRRVAAALRKKREGKWQQQRTVVGKQVAVGWDDRQELEGGLRRRGVDENKDVRSPLVDIQRVWRGVLSRMKLRAARDGQRVEREASVTIQRVFRGVRGRRQARKERSARESRITAAKKLTVHARRFVEHIDARRRQRHSCAITFQRAVRRFAARREAYLHRVSRREHAAARKLQSSVRLWLSGRQARQRTLLRQMGACALCCKRLAAVFFDATEQELCIKCYWRTRILLDGRGIVASQAEDAFDIQEHRKRDQATRLIQQAWLRFQQQTRRKYGTCEACARLERTEIDCIQRPRAVRAVCLSGCNHRRYVKYCRRCCAIVHSLRATSRHEIKSMDRYGAELMAAETLSSVIWRYNLKHRFWRIFAARRQALHSHATSIQSGWRFHRCRSVFSAVRKAFVCLEAATKSVERYWSIIECKDVVIPAFAGFLAHDIESSPPGIYPIPSGHKAVWETGLSAIIRCRAVEHIQRRWRERMLRVEAKALVEIARQERMERQRLCTLAKLRAATNIERAWRGHRGRIRARRRAATIIFAREIAEQYLHPSAFTVKNLRAFNAHGGFLGSAGLDARSLLAVAAGHETLRPASYNRLRGITKPRSESVFGPGTISLGLHRHEGDGGLALAVAGITEVAFRVCLRQCDKGIHEKSDRDLAQAIPSILWIERERKQFCVRNPSFSHYDDSEFCGSIDIEDEPPLTLKLEMISVQISCGVPPDTQSSDANLIRENQVLECDAYPFIGDEDSEHFYLCSESGPSHTVDLETHTVNGNDIASGTGAEVSHGSFTKESSTTRDSYDNMQNSIHSGNKGTEQNSWDRGNAPQDSQYQCEVSWCGQSVGGTRAPLRGLPVPHWEGQVVYLPLWAAGVGAGNASIPARDFSRESHQHGYPVEKDWQGTRKGLSHKSEKHHDDMMKSRLPPLLKVTLNELTKSSFRGRDGRPCAETSPWMAFTLGLKEPVPVGQVVLEAGDILGMLGSQQLVEIPAVPSLEPVHHDGASDKRYGEGSEGHGIDRCVWQLRLLLSLEEKERTRTRLMVTEVVASTIAEIIDLIPGRVARIELRVVGTRTLPAAALSSPVSRGQTIGPQQIPALPVSIEWNGEHAGVVELLQLEEKNMEPFEETVLNARENGPNHSSSKNIVNGVIWRELPNKNLPRKFMLPIVVPSIMTSTLTRRSHSIGKQDAEKRRQRCGEYGLGMVGGRSHCLRVNVGKCEPDIPRESLALRGENKYSGGPSSSPLQDPLARIRPRAKAIFYEHDLIRDDWTELLVPISATSRSDQVTAAPETAVVLQARSAGFHPKVPPMWLVYRDFSERTVRRIVMAASAAVTQPRVEVTVVGLLRGAVSRLLEENVCGYFKDRVGVSPQVHLLPALVGTGREKDDGHEEVICQAFWNGTLANELRLCRLNTCPSKHVHTVPRKTTSQSEIPADGQDHTTTERRHTRIPYLLPKGNDLAGRDERVVIDIDLAKRDHQVRVDRDPATWFFNGQESSKPYFHDGRMKLGDASSSPRQSLPVDRDGGQIEQDFTVISASLKEIENKTRLPLTTITEVDNPRKIAPSAFTWVPVETERYAQRPFRFFLPVCRSGNAGIVQDSGKVCLHRGEEDGGHYCEDETDTERGEQAPPTLAGKLSLVFWAVSPAALDCNTESIGAENQPRLKFKGIQSGQGNQPLKAPREQGCHLIGYIQLANDELVLQPPGKPVELPLLGDAGLNTSTVQKVIYGHKREVDAYRVASVSATIVMRHFDIPRAPILNLRCPGPFLEVEIIDGHRLNKGWGQLSTNPYVVLTLNGDPFARSTTCWGTAKPIWLAEMFRVRLPSPPPGTWPLTVQEYFYEMSKRYTSFILGAEVYNDVEHCLGPRHSRAGTSDSNTLLGEGHVPFSQLKCLPYHYIPICLSTPSSGCFPTQTPFGGGGGTRNHVSPDAGILGIGLRMLFPDPVVPVLSECASHPANSSDLSVLPLNEGVLVEGVHQPDYACPRDEIILRVHEAENLTDDARANKRSLNPYCVILFDGVEVGRTRTIPDSTDPLWETTFHLSDELLQKRSLLKRRSRVNRSGERSGETAESDDPRFVTPREVVDCSVDLEIWDRAAQGQPVLIGAAEIPTELMSELLVCDDITASDGPVEDQCSVAASYCQREKGMHLLKLGLRSGEDRCDTSQSGGSNFAAPADIAVAGRLETSALGTLSVSVRRVRTAAVKVTGTAGGVVAWSSEERNKALGEEKDNKLCADLKAVDSGRLDSTATSKNSFEAYCAARQQALAETSRGARAGLEVARAMVCDTSPALMGERINGRPRGNAEQFLLAWRREKTRAERAEVLGARRSSTFLRKERLDMLAVQNKRNASRERSTDSLRRKQRTNHDDVAQRALKLRREKRRAGRKDATRASGARIEACSLNAQETSSAIGFPIDRGAEELLISEEPSKLTRSKATVEFSLRGLVWIEEDPAIKTLVQSLAAELRWKMEGELDGEPAVAKKNYTSRQSIDEKRSSNCTEAGYERDAQEMEKTSQASPTTVLERILPPFPASRRELYLHIQGFSGLTRPLNARGSPILAKVFWGRQEVACTRHATDISQETPPALGDTTDNSGENGVIIDLIGASVSAAESALTLAAGGGTAAGQWVGETFRLPLLRADPSSEDHSNRSDTEDSDTAKGQPHAAIDAEENDSSGNGGNNDLNLRIEVWQGRHCYGQVEFDESELMFMCKKVQNASPGDRADFEIDGGNSAVRLPDHFPHSLGLAAEALIPHKIPLVPRDGEENSWHFDPSAQPARLALVLLLLEPGQVMAAQGQLAVALKARKARDVQLCERFEASRACQRCCPRSEGVIHQDNLAEASGIVESLTNVLAARRSPLSFRVELLALHAEGGERRALPGWWSESRLLLVARREETVFSRSDKIMPDTDERTGNAKYPTPPTGHSGKNGNSSSAELSAVEELGRSSCFTMRSATTILPCWWFAVPPSLLVADLRRRSCTNDGNSRTPAISRRPDGEAPESQSESHTARIVLELAIAGSDSNKEPMLGDVAQFWGHTKEDSDSAPNTTEVEKRAVVARAVLDPSFLRQAIGCQRSVEMKVTTSDEADQKGYSKQKGKVPSLIRLDFAGHAVSARLGPPTLRLQVLECQNLRRADMFGRSNPCVLVFWDGKEIGRTPIVPDDVHPVFPGKGSMFQLPLSPSTRSPEHNHLPEGSEFANWKEYAPELRLEVWDMDRDTFSRRWKRGECLGTVILRGPRDLAPILEASSDGSWRSMSAAGKASNVMLRLHPKPRRSKRTSERSFRPEVKSGGFISVQLTLENDTDEVEEWIFRATSTPPFALLPEYNCSKISSTRLETAACISSSLQASDEKLVNSQRKLQVRCVGARGLPLGCDAYCRVYWNGRQVGRTATASAFAETYTKASGQPAPTQTFQRNPVWWTQSSSISAQDGHKGRKHPVETCATACVPLNEASEGDELTVEIFDSSKRGFSRYINAAMHGELAIRHFVTSRGEAKTNPSEAVTSSHENMEYRDMAGTSLGTVTIRGNSLVNPLHGVIDLPVMSARQENAKTLGISLECLPTDETIVRLHHTLPPRMIQQSKDQHRRPKRWLRMLLIEACILPGLNLSGTSEIFCVVYVDRVWHTNSNVCCGTLTPRWGHLLEFEIFRLGSAAADSDWGHEVRIEVWTTDRVGADTFIGEIHLTIREDSQKAVEISPSTGYRPTQQEAGQNAPCTTTVMHGSRGRVGGEWERHLLRIFREGEREVPPDDKGSIGTLLCATQVYTEQNWSKEVESMHLPWSLGADIPFPAEKAGLVVVQLVGIVPKDGRTMFPVAPNSSKAPACFALLRWNGAVVGRTPDSRELHKPTWDEQVFALRSRKNVSGEVLEIEVYFSEKEDKKSTSSEISAKPQTTDSMVARCRLQGPFCRERFPQYASTFPLLRESKPSPPERSAKETSGEKTEISESDESIGAMKLRVAVVPSNVTGVGHTSAMGERAIGDEDPPEIRRRRTNKVERRLRLWIRWISLARLIRPLNDTLKGMTRAKDGVHIEAGVCSRQEQTNDTERDKNLTAATDSPPESTKSSPSLLLSTSGILCRVFWCGVLAAEFQLCPRTGLPLTPGECLLPLSRGESWKSCSLVLEVVIPGKYPDYSGSRMEECEHNDGIGCSKKGTTQCPPQAGGQHDNPLDLKNQDQDRLLGMVMVGWQALMSLQEQAYHFTTCPEDAMPKHDVPRQDQESGNGGGNRINLVCPLCIPTAISETTSLPEASGGSAGQDRWKRRDISIPQVTDETEAVQPSERYIVCCRGAWRVMPARLALSMTLERLSASRPPRLTRAPIAAFGGRLCRLRVGFVGRGTSVRASHPNVARPERFLPPGTAIFVGWNGCSDTVGPVSEWQVQLYKRGDSMTSDLNEDVILSVPPRGRERLLLNLFLKRPAGSTAGESQIRAAVDPNEEMVTLGQASIDWDGLSCLPRHATNYFVETMDGRSSTNDSLFRGMPVDLELVAPTSSIAISPPAHSRGEMSPTAMEPICSRPNENPRRPLVASTGDNQQRSRLVSDCRTTAGVSLRVFLRLEESPSYVHHELSLMPVAAGGPGSCISILPIVGPRDSSSRLEFPGSMVSPGDFRDPCRMDRVPYLRFSWLWDDRRLSLVERRTSLVPPRAWKVAARRAVVWPRTTGRLADRCTNRTGRITARLPLMSSGIVDCVSWPGRKQFRGGQLQDAPLLNLEDEVHRECSELYEWNQRRPLGFPVLIVQAYDMGNYRPLEHRATRIIQSIWRRAIGALERERLRRERDEDVRRYDAAVCVQENYRGWKARNCARVAREEEERRNARAAVIQRAWRVSQPRKMRYLEEVVKMQKLARDRMDVRRSKLFLLVARGAGLRPMDISGLSDPFCVILWNNEEIGRTVVRYNTLNPDWVDDVSIASLGGSEESAEFDGCFELPFIVSEVGARSGEPWPTMRLEIRCYDHDFIDPPELIGCVLLDTDDILAICAVSGMKNGGYLKYRFGATDSPATLTWLELQANIDNKTTVRPSSAHSSIPQRYREDRNPFNSLGDIALALTSEIPLPASLEEYQQSMKNGGFDSPRSIADAGVRAVIAAGERELAAQDRSLWVVNASGLCKADFFGSSDPYAKVFWDGREIGKTSVRRKTLNPVWFAEDDRGNSIVVDNGSRKQTKTEQPYFWLEGSASVNPLLRVEVYDWDVVGSHDFLGGVELDLSEVVKLQRNTLAKIRAHGESSGQQMILKTEYQLRSRDNETGKNGTVGLCVYLDLELEKRRERRDLVMAARRQQALDLEIAKADAKKEAKECKSMAVEDTDALDNSRHNSISKQQQEIIWHWQMFYDDTVNPPIPWWYNSVTGESTWECPVNREETIAKESVGLFSTPTADDSQDHRHEDLVIGENRAQQEGWQLFYDYDSSPGEPIPWWFNSSTGESRWECPVSMPTSQGLFGSATSEEQQIHRKGTVIRGGVPTVDANSEHRGTISSPWTRRWSDEHQAFYFFNEITQESTWEDPDSTTPFTEEYSVHDTASHRHDSRTQNDLSSNDLISTSIVAEDDVRDMDAIDS